MHHRAIPIFLVAAITLGASPTSAQLGDCTRIGPTATNHTCGHGVNGPYADLTAVATAVTGTPVPQKHYYTTVTLPGSGGVFQGELQWRYPLGGYHALWTLGDYPIVVRDLMTGTVIPEELGHDFDACPDAVSHVRVWDLGSGTRYRIQIGPVDHETVTLVAENLDDIATLWYTDADADGFGLDTDEPFISFCEQPGGYVENSAGDCDDTDPSIHPDPLGDFDELVCNGKDDDCDTLVDDGFVLGETCSVGTGVCTSSGVTVCASDEASTACDAVPITGSVESCNGVDDDCDGATDEGMSGCEDASVPPMDAGLTPDASSEVDAGGAEDASGADAAAGGDDSSAGCACRVRGAGESNATIAVVVCLLALADRGRRRSRTLRRT